MTNKEVTFQYQPSRENLIKASKYMLFTMPVFKYFPVMVLFVATVQLLPGILYPTDNEMTTVSTDNIFPLLGILPVFVLLYFIFIRSIKKNVDANPKNLEHVQLTFDNQGFTQKAQSFTTNYNWNNIVKIKETNEWFLIYLTKYNALPVFKSNVPPSQSDDLKNLFKSLNVKKSLK